MCRGKRNCIALDNCIETSLGQCYTFNRSRLQLKPSEFLFSTLQPGSDASLFFHHGDATMIMAIFDPIDFYTTKHFVARLLLIWQTRKGKCFL
jgi:hypothetical protein